MIRQITATIDDYRMARRRVIVASLVSFTVISIGALGYWYIGYRQMPGMWTFGECIYMTAITVTTVGFGEVIDVAAVPGGREWTMILLLFGISANLFVVSSITSFFVEGDFGQIRAYRRLQRQMKTLNNHYIVCGCGSTGAHVIEEMIAIGETVVAIDLDEHVLEHVEGKLVLPILGDATEDEILERAGISRAKGIVATLDDDKTNMFVVVSARQHNPRARIVAKAVQHTAIQKLQRAGADAVVSPNMIGGMRIASELVRPHVVKFLDDMLRDKNVGLRIEEAEITKEGSLRGHTLRGADVRRATGSLVLAVRLADGNIEHAPKGDMILEVGQTLIAIGSIGQIARLRELAGDRRAGAPVP
ncbi:MAG: potassium channel protein [Myxococcales bacterium]|nr:potassium channel protein [Myxococcales bacterium]